LKIIVLHVGGSSSRNLENHRLACWKTIVSKVVKSKSKII
jgi:hypothetical protein